MTTAFSNNFNLIIILKLFHTDRKYIELPIKPAPPPIVTVRRYSNSGNVHITNNSSTSHTSSSSHNYNHSSVNRTTNNSSYRSDSTSISNSVNTKLSTSSSSTADKRTTKKYGSGSSTNGKLDAPGSPSRSRSATKELILPPDDSLMCKPDFTKQLADLEIRDGEQLVLTCTVKGDPEPQVTWDKNGKKISSSEIIDLKYKSGLATLTINEIFPEDEGTYTCTATNAMGTTTTKCKLTVKPMENGNAKRNAGVSQDKSPKIVSHLESRFVKDGEAVTLACRIIGAEHFDVVWLHNNKEIKPSKDFEYTNEANIYKLQIAEIFPEDSGTYTCEAFNDAGESFSTCTINVLVPGEEAKTPTFVKFPTSVTTQTDENSKFTCELNEQPLELLWLKDGKQLDDKLPKYKFSKDGNKFTLEIVKCSVSDVGQYQIKAIGKKGETFSSFSVNVFSTET